jgi:hypothetical protein
VGVREESVKKRVWRVWRGDDERHLTLHQPFIGVKCGRKNVGTLFVQGKRVASRYTRR